MKSNHFFLVFTVLFALFFWFFDSLVHYFGYGEDEFEVIPSDFNELWMRATIVVLLVGFGVLVDYHISKLIKKNIEKQELYESMLNASNHILNNFLTSMSLFRIEAEESRDFDKAILKHYDQAVEEAVKKIQGLEEIDEPGSQVVDKKYRSG